MDNLEHVGAERYKKYDPKEYIYFSEGHRYFSRTDIILTSKALAINVYKMETLPLTFSEKWIF